MQSPVFHNEDDVDFNPTPEYLQRKLYFLLEHLKEMHSELPEYIPFE